MHLSWFTMHDISWIHCFFEIVWNCLHCYYSSTRCWWTLTSICWWWWWNIIISNKIRFMRKCKTKCHSSQTHFNANEEILPTLNKFMMNKKKKGSSFCFLLPAATVPTLKIVFPWNAWIIPNCSNTAKRTPNRKFLWGFKFEIQMKIYLAKMSRRSPI